MGAMRGDDDAKLPHDSTNQPHVSDILKFPWLATLHHFIKDNCLFFHIFPKHPSLVGIFFTPIVNLDPILLVAELFAPHPNTQT